MHGLHSSALLQLSSLGIQSQPGMTPLTLNVAANAVVVSSAGQHASAWGAGAPVGTNGMAFPAIVDYLCGMSIVLPFILVIC